ncbi:MAG: hypothetical protein ACOVK7_03150, partial [Burkholderiaceae bacterium]
MTWARGACAAVSVQDQETIAEAAGKGPAIRRRAGDQMASKRVTVKKKVAAANSAQVPGKAGKPAKP